MGGGGGCERQRPIDSVAGYRSVAAAIGRRSGSAFIAAEIAAVTAAAVTAETAEDDTAAMGAAALGEAPPPPQPPERKAAAVEPVKPPSDAFTVTGG